MACLVDFSSRDIIWDYQINIAEKTASFRFQATALNKLRLSLKNPIQGRVRYTVSCIGKSPCERNCDWLCFQFMHNQITENYNVPSLNNDDIKNSPGIPDTIADYMGLEYWHSKSDSKLTKQMNMLTTLMHLKFNII